MHGVLPAHQSFEADDRAGLEQNYRLIEDAQLMVVESGAQFGFKLEPPDGEGVHRCVEEFGAIAAQGLGAAHGGFGIVEEVFGAIVGSVAKGDSMLTLAERGECPSTSKGSAKEDCRRLATRMASLGSRRPSSRMANSSLTRACRGGRRARSSLRRHCGR